MLFSCMESNLFFMTSKFSHTCSINKHQGIIDLMLAMLKVRCSMASSQNEEEVRKLLNICKKEKDGSIRDANSMEEFVNVVKKFELKIEKEFLDSFNENDFSELSAVSMNTAVYACIIEQSSNRLY